ncbi:MAG TPA: hypothetical protein VG365_08560 [Solirubrobacteraceae bacterium]|nr:hypothetical protein [Solirubrobacteraceae bacterium]
MSAAAPGSSFWAVALALAIARTLSIAVGANQIRRSGCSLRPLVDAHAWWTTTPAQAVLAYVAAHLPAGAKKYTRQPVGGGTPGTVQTASETFSLPAVRGVLSERVLGARRQHVLTG